MGRWEGMAAATRTLLTALLIMAVAVAGESARAPARIEVAG